MLFLSPVSSNAPASGPAVPVWGAPPSALRLDTAETRGSREFVLVCSARGPETHASVAPFRPVFQTAAVAVLAVGRRGAAPHTCTALSGT